MATSEAFYRNAIDLNRYSNSVTKRLITAYNEIILDVTSQLAAIDDVTAPATAVRLRTILAQAKESLERWAVTSTNATAEELQGLAELQTEFAQEQLRQLLPNPQRSMVRTVEVSPAFAKSVVRTDPTQLNVFTLPGELEDAVRPAFSLTATQGSMITLPNGQTIEKTFRGLASSQADLFGKTVRNGLLTGETTQQIARRLKGRLQFGQEATTARQIALARGSVREIIQKGGELTRMANHQVNTVVRTSINQVANVASDTVYRANDDITEEYEYVATLDSRTSAICARLDGQKFPYGKGPKPPQHFNCRSTTIHVLKDEFYEEFGLEKEDLEPTKRPANFGKDQKARQVPAGMTYGEWLSKQPKGVQEEVLGKTKAKYFRRLAKTEKKGPQGALRSIVQKDGSELTLKQLRSRYGPPESIEVVEAFASAKALPEKSWYGEPLPKMKRGVTRDKTQALGRAFIKENAPEIGVWQSINKKQRNLERTIIERIEKKEIQKLKSKKEVIGMLERVEALEERQRKKAEKAFGRLREKMLLTSLSEEDVKRYASLPVLSDLQPSRLKVAKEALNDYVRMFNGRGIKPKKTGIGSVSLIEGIKTRAFNEGTRITIGNNRGFDKLRADLFHEITHTTERQNKWMSSWSKEWRNEKAFTRLHIAGIKDGIKLIEDETQSIKQWGKKMGLTLTKKGREMAAAGTIPTEDGKPMFMLQTLYPRGGYKSHERILLDKYMSPYMGKVYPLGPTTEVWTMGIEKFADKSGIGMYELWKAHPDLFEMIVGLSQS